MLQECEKCFGTGLTHEVTPKTCGYCNGKGTAEVVQAVSVQDPVIMQNLPDYTLTTASTDEEGDVLRYSAMYPEALSKKPWYIRLRDWYVGLFD